MPFSLASYNNGKNILTHKLLPTKTLINDKYNDRGTIAIGDLAGTVTHNWNTKNTIVQTIDQNGNTVFCDITRTTSTVTATISEAQTAATGGIITILVQRIG